MARLPFPFPRPRRRSPRRVGLVGAIALLLVAIAGGIAQCGRSEAPDAQRPAAAAPAAAQAPVAAVPAQPPERYAAIDGPAIADRDEVRGIWDALRRVARGPPFPYAQDGAAFANRERRLPQRERGWWREYTVETPGSPDRGARRLVIGRDGETWYTADHYRSFVRLALP